VKCSAAAGGLASFCTEVWAAAISANSKAAKTIVVLINPLPAFGRSLHPLESTSRRIAARE
jgi:hypothetical protein